MFRMMNYINSHFDNPLLAIAFSSIEKLQEYLVTGKLDILMISDGLYEKIKNTDSGNLYSLNMMIIRMSQKSEDKSCIYKYQRADLIIRDITDRLETEKAESGFHISKTVGVISHTGRCGKTELALALSMEDEIRGGLYVGMEEYGGILSGRYHADYQSGEAVNNLWYLVKSRSELFAVQFEKTVLHCNQTDILDSPSCYMDIRNITASDISWMLEQLKLLGEYTTIVFDIGMAAVSDWSVLECFDRIIMAEPEDEAYKIRRQSFERMLRQHELGKISGQIGHVCVPKTSCDSPDMIRWLEKMRKKGMIYE